MAQDLSTLTAGTWNIDASHSAVEFVVRHVVVSKVRGRFTDITGAITIADNPIDSTVTATIGLASINTDDEKRDEHLRSADFFDVANNPSMTFDSTSIVAKGNDYIVNGDLTINGTTKGIELALEFNGVAGDPWGGTRAGFSASTTINRKDFGLSWNVALEAGGFLVGEDIKIELEIEAIKA
jgi:polyisoprenoid-binding protein YceI